MRQMSAIVGCFMLASLGLGQAKAETSTAMAPGMWHKIRNGEPISERSITESAYIVLDDDGYGKASFQIALLPGDDVLGTLTRFQKMTGVTSGKGQAVFNVSGSELDQWVQPAQNGGKNHVPSRVESSREGLMVCLFSGAIRDQAGATPPPHCHAMLAGLDDPFSQDKGGFPAVGGHLGGATVNVVLEMHVDSYPEVIEKTSGGEELGGLVIGVSEKQAKAAREFLVGRQSVLSSKRNTRFGSRSSP